MGNEQYTDELLACMEQARENLFDLMKTTITNGSDFGRNGLREIGEALIVASMTE